MRQFILALAVITAAIPITTRAQNQIRSFQKTPDGQPDLQGLWTNDTFTPLKRPKKFEDKAFFTAAEQDAFQKEVRDHNQALLGEENLKTSGDLLQALKDRRNQHLADGPEDFSDRERCRTWNSPPMLPPPSNTQIQIVQTPGYVLLSLEMFGEVRIIPLDGRPHLAPALRQLKGDSRGRWEGHSLVVETTNFVRNRTGYMSDRSRPNRFGRTVVG